MMQAALGSKDEDICVERGGPPKAPVFGGANPASVPSHIQHQVTDFPPWMHTFSPMNLLSAICKLTARIASLRKSTHFTIKQNFNDAL